MASLFHGRVCMLMLAVLIVASYLGNTRSLVPFSRGKANGATGQDDLHPTGPGGLRPCIVLIVNTPPWHQEVLESVAKMFPVQNMFLPSSVKSCNSSHLVFDFKIRADAPPGHQGRTVHWLAYFEKYLANKTISATTAIVQRDVRSAVSFEVMAERIPVSHYDATIEASCYCHMPGYAWLGNWMLEGKKRMATEENGNYLTTLPTTRSCVFHEACPNKYHTPQSVWVSPHHDSYFIPSALPFAEEGHAVTLHKNSTMTSPAVCSIGNTARRNWNYLATFFHNATNDTKPEFRILGQGPFPMVLKQFKADIPITQSQPSDIIEFHRQIKENCHIVVLLVNPQTHPDYFLTNGSKLKLSGSIPPIIAYKKPYVMHHEIFDIYKNDLLPLNISHATMDDTLESFGPALMSVLQVVKQSLGAEKQH